MIRHAVKPARGLWDSRDGRNEQRYEEAEPGLKLSMAVRSGKLRIMPKRLITLISTEGKTPEQIASELLVNHAKYQAVLAKHLPEDPAKK